MRYRSKASLACITMNYSDSKLCTKEIHAYKECMKEKRVRNVLNNLPARIYLINVPTPNQLIGATCAGSRIGSKWRRANIHVNLDVGGR